MHKQPIAVSGHLKIIERQRGLVFYAKIRRPIRLPNGDVVSKQTHERLGPLWKGTGRPPEGFYTKRTAEGELQDRLAELRRSAGETLADGAVTFCEAAEAWFTHGETERGWKPSTRRDYRSALDRHLLPAFGDQRLVDIDTQAIERWRSKGLATKKLRRRTAVKLTAMLHGIFARARRPYGLKANP